MRWKWLWIVVLVVSACGKKGPNFESWPASISGFENFNETQKQEVVQAITDMNTRSGKTLVSIEPNPAGYPITFAFVDAPESAQTRAGYAIQEEETCRIELSSFLFDGSRNEYIESVVFHEVGHCAGLGHTGGNGDIMSATTNRFVSYNEDKLTQFFSSFFTAITFP